MSRKTRFAIAFTAATLLSHVVAGREATPHDAHAFTLPQCQELRAK